MKSRICFTLALIFLVTPIFVYQVADGMVLQLNLEKMIRITGTIVAGRCVELKKGKHPQYPNINVTYVKLECHDVLKGTTGPELTFMQFGHGYETPDLPGYNDGEDMLLFLYPKSEYGFTSPVGGHQGKLLLKTDPVSGKQKVIKTPYTKNLLKGIDKYNPGFTKDKKHNALRPEKWISDYDSFRKLIKTIVDQSANKEEKK